ncbi:hypothetical protein [Brevundimonas nasdae]|uniref:Uncharacterized protein n=1 Tax=Brevundimonas nasdae TaxID=172043 RepID=A0ACD4VR51_9CAUL|nr:hypothetical protein [Brevundimonas nasdae]WOB79899.1 hypothetical protein PZA08_06915 [Brevundimonas nasdae]
MEGKILGRSTGGSDASIDGSRDQAMKPVTVKKLAVVLEHRLHEVFEDLARECQPLVRDKEAVTALHPGEHEARDLRPVPPLLESGRLQFGRLDDRLATVADLRNQVIGFLNGQFDRRIGEDRLVVPEQVGAGEAGLIEGYQSGG